MNFKILFTLFFFGLFGLTTTSFAQITKEVDVYQGTSKTVQLQSAYGTPQRNSDPLDGNSFELIEVNGTNFVYEYTPDPAFLGYDAFSYKVFSAPFTQEIYTLHMNVMASMVEANDDFIHYTSQDEIIINVLANDEASSSNLNVTLAQVLNGSATINEDLTISYTPSDKDADYITYIVSDEFNTISSSTVYLSRESTILDDLIIKEYKIASGDAQYIILPNEDYTLQVEDYEYGSIEQINSFVYKYTADPSVDGSDEVNFTCVDGGVYQVDITILENYLDEGYVRDDVFYTASNTNIVFDVKLNDINGQYAIADYSDELLHLGNGEFSYTPTPYFVGTKNFFYTADDGFTEETGSIEVVVNNFKPTTYLEYNLSTPENQPRIIEYDVPLGTEYFEIASLPTHGSIELFTEVESVDVGCEEGIQKVFALYTPDADFVGEDDLTLRYCASDNNLCNNVVISLNVVASEVDDCICVDDCVWPGDANGDGKVSIVDALSIGRFIGNGGEARAESPYGEIYEGNNVGNWLKDQVNGKNIKHADTNGDGFITVEDLDEVVNNYGEINSVISSDILGVKNLPFFLTTTVTEVDSGDQVVLYVTIGTNEFPAIDIQGIAFAVNLPAQLVDSSSVEVEYLESGYFVKDAPYVSLTHQPLDGIVHTAAVKANSIGSTGTGLVATLSFIVEEDAEGFKDKGRRSAASTIGDIITTITASDIIIEDSRGYKYALPNTSLDLTLKSGEDSMDTKSDVLGVYPNPSSDLVKIFSENGSILNTVEVYSLEGRLMKSIGQINSVQSQIDVSDFENGLYIIKASSETNTYTTKMIKR